MKPLHLVRDIVKFGGNGGEVLGKKNHSEHRGSWLLRQ